MKVPTVVFVAITAMAFVVPSSAQEVTGVLDMTGMGIYSMEEAVMEAARGGKSSSAKAKAKVPASRLSFTPSVERRRRFLKSFVAKMRTRDPKTADEMAKLTASKDLIAEMGTVMAPYGLRTDNVADAYALWWIASWQASQGRDLEPNRTQFMAVKAQAGRALGAAMKSAQVSDAVKQEFAEACLMQTLLIDAALEKSKNDPGRRKEIARSVNEGARASGLKLEAMKLTPSGFVLKG